MVASGRLLRLTYLLNLEIYDSCRRHRRDENQFRPSMIGIKDESTLSAKTRYGTADYESLEEVLTEFLEEQSESDSDETLEETDESSTKLPSIESPLTAACFGVAGPVLNNTCRTTNIPWTIDGDKLAELLHIPQVRLLNDLEATGYGLQLLRPDEIEDLNPDAPSPPPDGTRALIAAGTGLGESLILWTGKDYQICPSEGGHADFAPNNDLEIELLRYFTHQLFACQLRARAFWPWAPPYLSIPARYSEKRANLVRRKTSHR